MKLLKKIGFAVFFLMCLQGHAQKHRLLGKWKATYDYEGQKMEVTYQIRGLNDIYKGYIVKVALKGAYEKDNSLVLTNISMKKGKGKMKYKFEYEGKKYETDATLKFKDKNHLLISYTYQGYSAEENWERVR